MKRKIKKNDEVKVIAGNDKGKTGKVLAVFPKTGKVIVEGCKVAKKAVKPSDKIPNGGFINKEIKAALSKEFGFKNPMLVPCIEKVVISVGAGELAKDTKVLQNVADTISLIAGQKAVITKAKKSVASFKVRDGFAVGVMVTLRKNNMFIFLDKLISVALPRVKDFRGLSRDGFDGRGNYNFGLDEQLMFPEVEYDKILRTHGMNISIVTTANSDKEAQRLLELIGVPFAKGRQNG